MSASYLLKETRCFRYCLFPYIRAEILGRGEQTFRGRELCGDPAMGDAQQQSNEKNHSGTTFANDGYHGRTWDEWNRAKARTASNEAISVGGWRILWYMALMIFTLSI
jgi:hypothetical protein